ncbi:MAG: serpin family protein [Bacteroidales bacterium]|nr:serpin family protein [Bacteroidales bacterium]
MKNKRYILIFALALAILGSGCSQDIVSPEFDYNLKSAKVIETNNEFGLELLKKVFETEDEANVMISPASVSIALGMAYNGAEMSTRDAFEEVLNYEGLTREELNEITKELIHVLVTNVSGNLLEIANSMWYDEGFPVEADFITLNSHYFDAEVKELEFASADAVKTINDWVSDKTHGKIEEIIDGIDPAVMMFLINAIYFNCVWEVEFDPDDTRQADFYNEDGSLFGKVDMMQLESTFKVAHMQSFSAIELPYKNGKFSMFLFLPSEESSVDQLVQELDGATWLSWIAGFNEQEDFTVYMPKFEFEFERSLKDDLKAMGLDVAFTEQADFSGISPIALYIADVIHKSYIKVNEEGTEAAAVTAVVMELTSIEPMSQLRLDRPFLFAITENSSKSILFMGKVAEPAY